MGRVSGKKEIQGREEIQGRRSRPRGGVGTQGMGRGQKWGEPRVRWGPRDGGSLGAPTYPEKDLPGVSRVRGALDALSILRGCPAEPTPKHQQPAACSETYQTGYWANRLR